jgi:hypothetical protein
MSTNSLQHRQQLAKCLIDLSARADELNEQSIRTILLIVANSIADKSDDELALLCADYAQIRIFLLNQDIKKESPEGDYPF